MRERRQAYSSISDDNEYNDYNDPIFCEHCASFGFPYEKMGVRLYRNSELINGQVPSDWQNWLMCYRCYNVIPKIHGKYKNNEIVGIKDVPDSPYEKNETIFLPVFDKSSVARTRIKINKNNRIIRESPENTDSDIIASKRKGYKVRNITEYNRY